MKRTKFHYLRASLYLVATVLLVILMACAAPASTTTSESECDPTCPVDIQPETPVVSPARPSPSDMVPRITIDELKQKMERGEDILIVDSRHKEEYDVAHIKGAVSAPLSVVVAGEWTFPLDKEIVFYCSWPNEKTSARAALELIDKGATNVKALKGGYNAWKEAGYPMETGVANSK